jgi:hypothetical protein
LLLALLAGFSVPGMPRADEMSDVEGWLDSVSDDNIVEQIEGDLPGQVIGSTVTEEPEAVASTSAREPADSALSDVVWPDPYVLQGMYGIDPIALDEDETPPYCRSCARPGCGANGCGSCGGGCTRPTWFAEADYVALKRSSAKRINLTGTVTTEVIGNQIVTFHTVNMSTKDLDFKFEPGTRLTIGRFLGTDYFKRVHSLEFSFLGFFNYSARHSVSGPDVTVPFGTGAIRVGNFVSFFPNTVGGFSGSDFQSQEYSSNFNNYELNYRVRRSLRRDSLVAVPGGGWQRRCTPGFTPSFLFGLRHVSITEDFGYHSMGIREVFNALGQVVSNDTARGDYLIHTTNNLFGFQIGGDLVQQYCQFNVGLRGKTGLYGNWATQRSVVTSSDSIAGTVLPNTTLSNRREHSAVITEFGFVGNWHARANMNLRAAYDFMWIVSLANAPLQLTPNPTGPPPLAHGGITFFQGWTLGFEYFW